MPVGKIMGTVSIKVVAIRIFLLVFRGSIVHKAAKVVYHQGFSEFFRIAIRKIGSKFKNESSEWSPSLLQAEEMAFDLPAILPSFSVVAVLYNKEKEIDFFLKSFEEQTYNGEIEIVLVDDCSPDQGLSKVAAFQKRMQTQLTGTTKIRICILENTHNSGNCNSRNKGIAASTGDIVIVMDADCVVNRDFLKAHAEAYKYGDCDAAIGPMNIETNYHHPLLYRDELEKDFRQVFSLMELQDQINERSFLNCVTRNFSIRRGFINEPLFDEDFSYSKKPESGFGWEDVEMGYRLYKRGARIKFLRKSFALHVTHPPSVNHSEKSLKSLKNFRRLFDKNPELALVARRWSLETYRKISLWVKHSGHQDSADRTALDLLFKQHFKHSLSARRKASYRILTYRWHVPHQYELYKLPHRFTLATGIVDDFTKSWSFDQRPMPKNAQFEPISKINKSDYDLAILHFDENVLDWQNTNQVLDINWGANFRYFMEELDLPKVAICHGTPQFYGQYNNLDVKACDLYRVIEPARRRLVDYMQNVLVICNSHQAQAEWQFKQSKVIWQGFDPLEYQPALYNKGILTLGKAMKERPHYRGYENYLSVFQEFPKEWMPIPFKVEDPKYERNTNAFANAKYTNFINSIREYSIYFNPTIRSPMPRSRGEAMMCGLTTVSIQNHDVDLFIRNGVNGFYSNDPAELRDYLVFLMKNPEACRRIGMAGRKTSLDLFNHDRYLNLWTQVLDGLLSNSF